MINNNCQKTVQRFSKQQQLPLFPLEDNPPPYPLQIVSISDDKRIKPDFTCSLIHCESGLKIPGQFTYQEAQEILETTRYWDFTLERDRIPRCRERLLKLLEKVCWEQKTKAKDNRTSKSGEVAL
ncbi:MAG: hypothetical protein ACRC80_22455 [Waterburya sp.]